MSAIPVKVRRLHPDAVVPQYQTYGAAGFDLHAVEEAIIKPGETALVRTGLAFELPPDYALFIYPRSGVSLRTKLRVANSVGVVDSDYRGDVSVIIENIAFSTGDEDCIAESLTGSIVTIKEWAEKGTYIIRKGDRIAQGVIQRVPRAQFEVVGELSETERGAGGFGSTGVDRE